MADEYDEPGAYDEDDTYDGGQGLSPMVVHFGRRAELRPTRHHDVETLAIMMLNDEL